MTTTKLFAASLAAVAVASPSAWASSAPDAGRAFEPPAPPPTLYGVKAPAEDPARQVRMVTAADGTQLYTETWLPAPKDGNEPPEQVPVILVYTPYAVKGGLDHNASILNRVVPRGYALTYAHVRGTGGSGGCIEQTAANEVADGARIVQDAGELAPWSNGSLGMYGLSYPGATQIATATGPDSARIQSLKTLVVGAPVASAYEFYNHDGVPHLVQALGSSAAYLLLRSHPEVSPEHLLERPGCQPPILLGAADASGDYTPFYAARDHTRNLDRLTTPLLMLHGHADTRVGPHQQTGLFDGLPAGTVRKGLFGVHDHEYPDDFYFNEPAYTSPRLDWKRADWEAMVLAWYERWLRGVENDVESWPTAQVQGTDGQWRTASTWPRVPGPQGSLLLGGGGQLGVATPAGSTSYVEAPVFELQVPGASDVPGTIATFTTPPLSGRLELVGQPELDLWVTLLLPDSHVSARLEVIGADGTRLLPEARTMGARSARHLQPFAGGRFRQAAGQDAPILTPFKLTIRLNPTELVVPAGARLRLTIAGSSIAFDGLDGIQQGLGAVIQGPTLPSGLVQPVQVLHSCTHRSVLRFTMPETGSELINVREQDEGGALSDDPSAPAPPADGGGLATQPACPGGGGLLGLFG